MGIVLFVLNFLVSTSFLLMLWCGLGIIGGGSYIILDTTWLANSCRYGI